MSIYYVLYFKVYYFNLLQLFKHLNFGGIIPILQIRTLKFSNCISCRYKAFLWDIFQVPDNDENKYIRATELAIGKNENFDVKSWFEHSFCLVNILYLLHISFQLIFTFLINENIIITIKQCRLLPGLQAILHAFANFFKKAVRLLFY